MVETEYRLSARISSGIESRSHKTFGRGSPLTYNSSSLHQFQELVPTLHETYAVLPFSIVRNAGCTTIWGNPSDRVSFFRTSKVASAKTGWPTLLSAWQETTVPLSSSWTGSSRSVEMPYDLEIIVNLQAKSSLRQKSELPLILGIRCLSVDVPLNWRKWVPIRSTEESYFRPKFHGRRVWSHHEPCRV